MAAAIAVVVYIAVVLGFFYIWFKNDGVDAPDWLMDKEPHDKYDEDNDYDPTN